MPEKRPRPRVPSSRMGARGVSRALSAAPVLLALVLHASGCSISSRGEPVDVPVPVRLEILDSVVDFEDFNGRNGVEGELGLYSYGLYVPGFPGRSPDVTGAGSASGGSADGGVAAAGDSGAAFRSADGAGAGGSSRYALAEGTGLIDLAVPTRARDLMLSNTAENAMIGSGVLSVTLTGFDESGRRNGSVEAALAYESGMEAGWVKADLRPLGKIKKLGFAVSATGPLRPRAAIDDIVLEHHFFTVALLPDTQKYSEKFPEIFYNQTDFLARNRLRDNIVFVSHLGDVVEHGGKGHDGNRAEWLVAKSAMSMLDGLIPYGIVVGNHDYDDEWNPSRGSANFTAYFGPRVFESYPWWGGASSNGLSSFQRFWMGNRDFIYLHLEVDAPGDTRDWALRVLADNLRTPALVTTHVFLRANGTIINVPYLGWIDPSWTGISAHALFDEVIAPNDNVFMVTCGHISDENLRVEANRAGNPVFMLLQDYQNRESGGQGFLRLLRFYPAKDAVHVVTYSPWLDVCETDPNSDFVLRFDFSRRLSW